MTDQVIWGSSLKNAFNLWQEAGLNSTINPLSDRDKIAKGLKMPLASTFDFEQLNAIRLLSEGAINWLLFKRVYEEISEIDLETPSAFEPVTSDNSWWPIAQLTIGILAACDFRAISFNSENKGALFQNLVVGENPKSRGRLRGHTDAVAFPFQKENVNGYDISASPNFVVLAGIRNPKKVPTWLAPAQKVYSKVDQLVPGTSNLLFESCYDIAPQPSFDISMLPPNYILSNTCLRALDPDGHQVMRFKNSGIYANNSLDIQELRIQNEALRNITKSLETDLDAKRKEIFEEIVVEPGDILIVNNRCALHGRGKVADQDTSEEFGGRSRWLLRTYGYKPDTNGVPHNNSSFCMLP